MLISKLRALQEDWELTTDELAGLGHTPPEMLELYLGGRAPREWLEPSIPPGLHHVIHLVAIYERLKTHLPDVELQHRWMTTPHPEFQGMPPVQVCKSSPENLAWVSYTLASGLELQSPHS